MTPQPKSPNADLDRLDALYKSGADVGNWRGWTDTITAAYPALSRELRELRERLNPQPCTVCDGTGLVDADADDGGANCGVCRNGMVDEVSRQLSVIERQAKEIEGLRRALQVYASQSNWQCARCQKLDPLNCFCSQWTGPLLSGGKGLSDCGIDEAQPWGIAGAALKEEPNAAV